MGRCTSIRRTDSVMSHYQRFAEIYDTLMTDISYDVYANWVSTYAPSEQFPNVLDVGCGTGVLGMLLAQQGYAVRGLDVSEEMLAMAATRFSDAGFDVPLYCMSMHELIGFSELDVVTIAIDSLNYLIEEADVLETLQRIFNSLRQGGQLFFDVHSLFKMDTIFLDGPFTYDDGAITYVWHTEPGAFEHSVYHQMTFFVPSKQFALFERFDEEHYQRTFAVEQYINWLQMIGFSSVEVTADWTTNAPCDESERIFIRAVK